MTAASPRALTTRALDFWLLGGLSLVVWAVVFVADRFRTSLPIDRHFETLAATTLALSLVVNYPHFMLSYTLAYARGFAFVRRHWCQLVAVPAGLAALFGAAYALYDVPVNDVPWLTGATDALGPWGANAQVLSRPQFGDVMLTGAFHVMTLTIGWHYTKQVFGCVMVCAHYEGYPLSPGQRTLIRRALLTIWAMSVVDYNLRGDWRAFSTFSYSSFDLPDVVGPLAQAVVLLSLALVALRVFVRNRAAAGRWPSANMLVPVVALCVWWMPLTRQEEFFYLLAPLFHSLQYLAFVYRVEDARLRREPRRELWASVLVCGVVLVGWLAFEWVPASVDARLGTARAWGVPFFFVAAMLFINIHHYFIDNVIWRFADPRVRAYLLD